MSNKIKAVVSERTIVLHYQGKKVNIQKQTDEKLFEEVRQLIDAGDAETLTERFADIAEKVAKFSNNLIEVEEGRMYLKGSDVPIPTAIIKKLTELDKDGKDFLPLIRFWKKLAENPSKNSREQLYGFMLANNIPLTEQGDIVVEKGVDQKRGGLPGELVDTHSGSVDNSVGMVVEMPREKVVDNPNQTCSRGLHVAAPDYVRNWWSGRIILECVVNPKDVVSVPVDYNNTKMRVCRYQVMGYSPKSPRTQQVVGLSDFIKTPDADTAKEIEIGIESGKQHNPDRYLENKVKSLKMPETQRVVESNQYAEEIDGMTAKQIIEHVEKKTGFKIELSLKNKQGIAKKAIEVLEQYDTANQLAEFTGETKGEKGPWNVVYHAYESEEALVNYMKDYIKEGDVEEQAQALFDRDSDILFEGVSKRFAKSQEQKLNAIGVNAEMVRPGEVKTEKGTSERVIELSKMTIQEMRDALQKKFNEKTRSRITKGEVTELATKFFKGAGYTIK